MSTIVLSSIFKPEYLTRDYKSNLLKLYKEQYESTGIDIGYIVKILKIIDIISTNLDNNSQIVVESLCSCQIFKPEIGMKVTCTINMIHVNGIFVNKYDIKILVPSSNNDYEYNNDSFKFNNKKYKVGDNLDIEIINIRYDKSVYSCIGKLILKD